jgi:hypothetical protein
MLFVALTNAGPFDIGDFVSEADARAWSESRYGADLLEVVPQPTTAVNVTTTPPLSPLLIAALAIGAVVLLWGGKQGGSTHVEI